MAPDKVMECLAAYKAASARCGHLAVEIDRMKKDLEEAVRDAVADACIGAQQYTGMPHGSGFGDPTGNIATLFADGHVPEHIKELQRDIREAEREHDTEHRVLRYVDSWLRALSNSEQFVIRRKVIDDASWKSVCLEYRELYLTDTSRDTLKRIRERALAKIMDISK